MRAPHTDRIENLTEWWGALALTLLFVAIVSSWRRWGLVATIRLQTPRPVQRAIDIQASQGQASASGAAK